MSRHRKATEMTERVPTSVILEHLARDAPADEVTLGWIVENLGRRSFGTVMLLVALVGLLPGTSPFVGLLLMVPAVQMILGRDGPVLPRRIARRRFSTARFVRMVDRVVPVLRSIERVVRPRWSTPFQATKRAVGLVVLLLGGTLLVPVPFSHIIPILAIMLLAFAFLEVDGVLLAIAMVMALVSLTLSAAAIWGTVEVGLLL